VVKHPEREHEIKLSDVNGIEVSDRVTLKDSPFAEAAACLEEIVIVRVKTEIAPSILGYRKKIEDLGGPAAVIEDSGIIRGSDVGTYEPTTSASDSHERLGQVVKEWVQQKSAKAGCFLTHLSMGPLHLVFFNFKVGGCRPPSTEEQEFQFMKRGRSG
jgi:hypothetical protein